MNRIDVHGSYVYHLIKDGKVVYVGQSNKLVYRLSVHRTDKDKDFDFIDIFKVDCRDIDVAEFLDIAKYNPILNKILPPLYFAMCESRVKQINKCLDDSGIPFEKFDMGSPDVSVELNGITHKLWAKRGLRDAFDCMCNGLEDKVNEL